MILVIEIVIAVAVYLSFCLLVAYLARRVTIGFAGVFICSIILTPVLTALFIVIFKPRYRRKTLEEWANED